MKVFHSMITPFALLALATVPAHATEGAFSRTFKANGRITLRIACDSGSIHIIAGAENAVYISGQVKDLHPWGKTLEAQETRFHQLAANPPVRQTGAVITVGNMQESKFNVRIDYEIEAPPNSDVDVYAGTGDVEDEGVGENVHLNTSSGSIHATGLTNGFAIQTGSGDIVADGGGAGAVSAHSTSGNIELHNLTGGLSAKTGAGDIKIDGRPGASWQIAADSGSVEYWPNRAPMDLEAVTTAGSIHVDGTTEAVRTDQDRHSLNAKLRGGGPPVHIETGSGEIRVH
jgi:hypothetical protein